MGRRWARAAIFGCIAAFSTHAQGADETRVAVFGDLSLPYDQAIWEEHDGGMRLRDRWGAVDVRIGIGEADACSAESELARAEETYTANWLPLTFDLHPPQTISRPRFDIHVATIRLFCRNWNGDPVFACAAHGGQVYTFTAAPEGCPSLPDDDERVLDLLGGLVPR